MKDQFDRLREVASWPRAEVLVIPAATTNHPGLEGGFKLVRVPDSDMVVYQETRQAAVWSWSRNPSTTMWR
ncbi:Scr1 family TA system antitoxin-like transcriptional regulator [Nocardiopsis suaedae]|uniref:Scr1 family TA system antitoxin-like transcriptional regulator n=1 Tax=Nocardiopsis suaedae TaxID=3018444 RepID=A0ABT4TLD3_9ACTN|nr:Scr1 family TA system antitoxin-like transcriptional regulator [Nocardiopsis suaedae]MDA2805039.1 Scr1 family TA system antitoxin-like transcriptional regulator [Nocardiopsis suaedae]